jgi:hypothetical protein
MEAIEAALCIASASVASPGHVVETAFVFLATPIAAAGSALFCSGCLPATLSQGCDANPLLSAP